MNLDRLVTILGSIIVLATVTTLILPGRQTPAVIKSFGDAFTGSLKVATGQK